MKKTIDCLLIGQNQVPFADYEKNVREMGIHSGAYRDLDKNTLRYQNRLYSGANMFNLFCCADTDKNIKPIKPVETFSAAIAYLGTYLHRRGFTFDYINDFQAQKKDLAWKLEHENILTAAVTTTLYVAIFPLLEVIGFIRQHNPQVKIIVGGPFISTKVRSLDNHELGYLFNSLDADFYVNSSQGEAALVNIIQALKNKLPVTGIKNIYYRENGKNKYLPGPMERENNSLAENMVDWSLFGTDVGEFVNVRTGISCPFSCSFCGFPQHAGTYQTAPVEAIEEELNRLDKIQTVKSITFVDDTFNIPVKRFKEILRMLVKNRFRFCWNSFFRCQYADLEMVELMKESGVESVFLGLESGSNQILKNMNKEASVEQFLRGMELLNRFDITTFGNFIIGFPGENEETARATIDFIKNSSLDFYRAQLWYCELITPIWQQRELYDLKGESFEWSHKTMNASRACDIIEELIKEVRSHTHPTRLIQYYFDYDNVMQLTYKGLTLAQVKQFLQAFDSGVRQKIMNPAQREISFDIIKQIKSIGNEECSAMLSFNEPVNAIDEAEAALDF